jgi:hypothetical protein
MGLLSLGQVNKLGISSTFYAGSLIIILLLVAQGMQI